MGKRKTADVTPDPDGFLRTGIYERYVGPPRSRSPDEQKQYIAWLRKQDRSAAGELQGIRERLVPLVKSHVTVYDVEPADIHTPVSGKLNFGAGRKWFHHAGSSDQINEVLYALDCIDTVEQLLDAQTVDQASVLRVMFQLGQFYERIQIRPFEPLVRSELGRRKGSRLAASVTNADHIELHTEFGKAVEKYMKLGVKYTPATEKVATEFGVSGKTVRTHFPNPSPRIRRKMK